MFKSLLFVAGIAALSFTANGQSQFGLKAGVNLANQLKTFTIPPGSTISQDTRPLVGYQVGMFYKTQLHDRILVSAEANFSTVGSRTTLETGDGKKYDVSEKLGYVELPLTLQLAFKKVYFGLGPSIGFKLFSKLENFENRTYDIEIYRTLDAAGNVLAGYKITKKLDGNVRYSHGSANLYQDPGNAVARNRFFNFSFLYSFK